MAEWSAVFDTPKKQRHWKQHRSAYSLADYVMNHNGLHAIRKRCSEALGTDTQFQEAMIEQEIRFDVFGHGREHDLGIRGITDTGQSVFVGLEAKVDEAFGASVLDVYLDSKAKQLSGISTNAPQRIEQLLQFNFRELDRHKFNVRYQLLYATAGTVAAGADVSILYILVFKTPLYNELVGADNYRDYLAFMEQLKARPRDGTPQGTDIREVALPGHRLTCLYETVTLF